MRIFPLRPVVKAALTGAALLSLQACAPAAPPDNINVAQAFETSEVMTFKPYTRSIFSTTDF